MMQKLLEELHLEQECYEHQALINQCASATGEIRHL